jgi:hypothetical protein
MIQRQRRHRPLVPMIARHNGGGGGRRGWGRVHAAGLSVSYAAAQDVRGEASLAARQRTDYSTHKAPGGLPLAWFVSLQSYLRKSMHSRTAAGPSCVRIWGFPGTNGLMLHQQDQPPPRHKAIP